MNRRGSGRTQNTGGNSPSRSGRQTTSEFPLQSGPSGVSAAGPFRPPPDESSHAGPPPDGRKKDRGKNPRSSITARSLPPRRSGRSAEATRPAAARSVRRGTRPRHRSGGLGFDDPLLKRLGVLRNLQIAVGDKPRSMANVAARLKTTMAIAIDQVNFSRKFVVSRTPITWFDAPKLAAMPLLGSAPIPPGSPVRSATSIRAMQIVYNILP